MNTTFWKRQINILLRITNLPEKRIGAVVIRTATEQMLIQELLVRTQADIQATTRAQRIQLLIFKEQEEIQQVKKIMIFWKLLTKTLLHITNPQGRRTKAGAADTHKATTRTQKVEILPLQLTLMRAGTQIWVPGLQPCTSKTPGEAQGARMTTTIWRRQTKTRDRIIKPQERRTELEAVGTRKVTRQPLNIQPIKWAQQIQLLIFRAPGEIQQVKMIMIF